MAPDKQLTRCVLLDCMPYSLCKLIRTITITLNYLEMLEPLRRVQKEECFAVLSHMLRQQSRDGLRALCWWISSSRLWDWAWQLAQWRWFMTGQESQRWMRRNNFDQSCSLTTEESSFLVPVDIWHWPDFIFQGEAAESVSLFYSCKLHRVQMVYKQIKECTWLCTCD